MPAETLPEQLVKYLTDVHSTEENALRMLRLVAEHAGDQQTVQVAERILAQEHVAAEKLEGLLELVAEYDLQKQGLAA